MASPTKQDRVRELQRTLYRAAKADPHGDGRMPAVKDVGEPCAGEPHARFEVAAGGNRNQSALPHGTGASRRPYTQSTRSEPCRTGTGHERCPRTTRRVRFAYLRGAIYTDKLPA